MVIHDCSSWKSIRSDQGPATLDNLFCHPMLHLSSYAWPTWIFTREYMQSVIFAETKTWTNGPFIEDDQFLVFLFLLYQTRSISTTGLSINFVLCMCTTDVSVIFISSFTWKLQSGEYFDYRVETTIKQRRQFLPFQRCTCCDNTSVYLGATGWTSWFVNLFCVNSTRKNSFIKSQYVSFFLGFQRPNLITGQSWWRAPD